MRYKDELIDEIRSANDIVSVIGSVIKLKRSGSNYFGLCPFHSEKTGSFCVNPLRQTYHCFGCDAGGNVISFVMEYENYSFPEAVKYLANRAGIELPAAEETEEEKAAASFRNKILECLKSAAVFYYWRLSSEEGKKGLAYFKKRGLTDETIKSFGLGFSGKGYDQAVKYLKSKGFSDKVIDAAGLCNITEKYGMTDRFFNRVMFPIMDINNKVIGFGGRVMGDGEPKYINSPETDVFDKSHNMYGLNVARKSRKPYRIVCEGYMDVISMHQAGFTEAVASLGTAFTPGHASLLHRYTDDLRLTYDSDNAGMKAAVRAIHICRDAGFSTKVINLSPYKDPDEFIKALGPEEFQKRIDDAENSFFFELSYLERSFDMNDPEGRTRFQSEAAAKLAQIKDELARDNYISSVAAKYSIREDTLRRAVAVAAEKGFSDTPVTPVRKTTPAKENKKDDSALQAEKYLLTWMSDDRSVYDAVKEYLSADDFSEGIAREIAEMIYEGYEKGQVSPADILSRFASEDRINEASAILNKELITDDTASEKEKALTDLVIRIKQEAFNRKNTDGNVDVFTRKKEEKRVLEELRKIRIKI